jgi:hypothetical protein
MTADTAAWFFIVIAACYLIGSLIAEDKETERFRDIIFWICVAVANILGWMPK